MKILKGENKICVIEIFNDVYCSCGIIKSHRRQGRTHPLVDATIIGGGKRTGPETGPWVVSIGYHDENGYNHVCSGAILSRTVIITAAHCVAKSYKGFVKSIVDVYISRFINVFAHII